MDTPNTLDILKKIESKKICIPQFQRDFKWGSEKMKLLIDSMARNYPMGSLLVLPKTPNLEFESRPVDAYIKDADSSEEDTLKYTDIVYVLDGQQRITSIARVFLNADPDQAFYFDLKEMINSFDKGKVSWITKRKRKKDTPCEPRRERNKLIRADIALFDKEGIAGRYIHEYFNKTKNFPDWKDDESRRFQEISKIQKVFEKLRNYKIPVVTLGHDTDVESVCRIFETINSTGKKLTTFDLAVARCYRTLKIRVKWEEALDTYPVLKEFSVDGERVLQILVMKSKKESGHALEVNRGAQLDLNPNYIEKNWEKAITALADSYTWAKDMGARPETLTNHALLVAIGSYWCVYSKRKPNHDLLKRWFFSVLLQKGAQAANYRIGQYFKALHALTLKESDEIDQKIIPKINITPEILLSLNQATDNRFKALQCILTAAASKDLKTGQEIAREDIENHHIYPIAYCKKEKLDSKLRNSIVNLIAVSRETNRSLGSSSPKKYFADIVDQAHDNRTVEGMQNRLRSCFIPNAEKKRGAFLAQFTPLKFKNFMHERAKLLVDEVRRVVGNSLVTEEPDDYDEDD
ncbi:MAG: DUF262 domain-containing protein [Candidatus Electrothrix sp. EH2]|nr:DUF262 domain-containing protein [Candidatus Electrothrix sp. EH2]